MDTGSQNIPALSLYQKNGFEIIASASKKSWRCNCTQKPSFSRKDIVVRKFQFEKLRKSEFEEHHRYD
ncbi:hypothetical protein [Blautia massiliensis (ex Durand et al. 2017)]|uniref:hypothetical protein n=1 Tax=Blautia massiliensis (ex Durand et al. 2017) TaxID=1737424 RepID=UPI003992CF10